MRKHLAVLLAAAGIAAIVVGGPSASGRTASSAADVPACQSVKHVYSIKNWRERNPKRGVNLCRVENKAGARRTIQHFHEYQTYRHVATMKCLPGPEGYFVTNVGSCSTIECESHFNWWAVNPSSGALYIYQLLGHGAPPPSSFHNRLVNHEIAADRSRSEWAC